MSIPEIRSRRERLRRSARLNSWHWLVVAASLILTIVVWQMASRAAKGRAQVRFDAEVDRVLELLVDRMGHYEDGLWAGVAHIRSLGGDVTFEQWRTYANQIAIERKYPGINGIGVIHAVPRRMEEEFLARQRATRPDFSIHPAHTGADLMPISYIVPVEGNEKAVGLDMAHEANRFTAARRAVTTQSAQITGPIVLVQDAAQTPGFLFYAPIAADEPVTTPRAELVYAPFVVKRLLEGVLAQRRRLVSLRISDGAEVIYDELQDESPDRDPEPMFSRTEVLELYGRTWTVAMDSSATFRAGEQGSQPLLILLAGLLIDALLLYFFHALSRANSEALTLADEVASDLEVANDELIQFNYRTSHDLVAPLRTIEGYVDLARDFAQEGDPEAAARWLEPIGLQAERMAGLIENMLALGRADTVHGRPEPVDLPAEVTEIAQGLAGIATRHGVEVRLGACDLDPPLVALAIRVRQVLANLVANGIRYSDPEKAERWVEVSARNEGSRVVIEVADNGLGVDADQVDRIFEMFYRASTSQELGSGLGLYLVKKHVDRMKGTIEVRRRADGTTFRLELPVLPADASEPPTA